jgi:hypothetical protein
MISLLTSSFIRAQLSTVVALGRGEPHEGEALAPKGPRPVSLPPAVELDRIVATVPLFALHDDLPATVFPEAGDHAQALAGAPPRVDVRGELGAPVHRAARLEKKEGASSRAE